MELAGPWMVLEKCYVHMSVGERASCLTSTRIKSGENELISLRFSVRKSRRNTKAV